MKTKKIQNVHMNIKKTYFQFASTGTILKHIIELVKPNNDLFLKKMKILQKR